MDVGAYVDDDTRDGGVLHVRGAGMRWWFGTMRPDHLLGEIRQ